MSRDLKIPRDEAERVRNIYRLDITQTLVHLDYLEFQNKVQQTEKNGTLLYWSEDPWRKIGY